MRKYGVGDEAGSKSEEVGSTEEEKSGVRNQAVVFVGSSLDDTLLDQERNRGQAGMARMVRREEEEEEGRGDGDEGGGKAG